MVIHTRHLVVSFSDLTIEERNLFSIALKNLVTSRRAAWRILSFIEKREKKKGNLKGVEMTRETRKRVEKEVEETCLDATEVRSLFPFSWIRSPTDAFRRFLGHPNLSSEILEGR